MNFNSFPKSPEAGAPSGSVFGGRATSAPDFRAVYAAELAHDMNNALSVTTMAIELLAKAPGRPPDPELLKILTAGLAETEKVAQRLDAFAYALAELAEAPHSEPRAKTQRLPGSREVWSAGGPSAS